MSCFDVTLFISCLESIELFDILDTDLLFTQVYSEDGCKD